MIVEAFANLFARHRWVFGWGVLIITAIAAWGNFSEVPHWRSTTGLPAGEHFELLEQVNENLSRRGGDLLLVIESQELFEPDALSAVRRIEQAVESLDDVAQVLSLDDVPDFNALGFPVVWMPRGDAPPEKFAAARARALAHPLVLGQLLSDNGTTLMLPVVLGRYTARVPRRQWLTSVATRVRQAAVEAAENSQLRVRTTGRVPLRVEQDEAFDRDHVKFLVVGGLLAFVLAGILFRGAAAVLIVAGAPLLGVFWTLGALHILDEGSNKLVSVIMPIMLIMVGFTDGIHLMVDIRRARADGVDPIEASRHAIRHLGTACALTSLTTAIGFGSLMLADSEVIQTFGRSCAIGVALTFLAVIMVVPLLCSTWFGRRVHAGHEHDIVGRNLDHFHGAIDWILAHARAITVFGTLITMAFTVVALRLRPDYSLGSDFPSSSESYQALAHCDAAFGGVQTIAVVLDWDRADDFDPRTVLATVGQVETLLAAERLVHHPFSIRNLLHTLNAPDDDLAAALPLVRLFPAGLRDQFLNLERRRAVVVGRMRDLGTARNIPVFEHLEQEFDAIAQQTPGLTIRLSGEPVVTGREINSIIGDLRKSLATAAVVILVVIGFVYRSVRLGLISIVPNLFPLVFTATLLVVMGRPLEIESVCAFTICLGIAVDDTIHFLSRYQRELSVDGDVRGAIRRSFIGVATALMMSTVALVAGFGAVLTSELPDFRLFAAMACSTIGSALIGDLVFLPAMLAVFAKSSRTSAAPAATDVSHVASSIS